MVDEVASSNIARRRLERGAAVGRRSDERWASILAAATTVFRELGYEKATLEDIANEVGINRATLYYYVGTKEELLVALLAEPIEMVRTRLEEDAAAKTKTLVKELVAHNVPLRDIGAMLGLSFQRVHQLAA